MQIFTYLIIPSTDSVEGIIQVRKNFSLLASAHNMRSPPWVAGRVGACVGGRAGRQLTQTVVFLKMLEIPLLFPLGFKGSDSGLSEAGLGSFESAYSQAG